MSYIAKSMSVKKHGKLVLYRYKAPDTLNCVWCFLGLVKISRIVHSGVMSHRVCRLSRVCIYHSRYLVSGPGYLESGYLVVDLETVWVMATVLCLCTVTCKTFLSRQTPKVQLGFSFFSRTFTALPTQSCLEKAFRMHEELEEPDAVEVK